MGEPGDARAGARTVRDWIDETPVWPDGTPVASAPLTAMQKRIWVLAAAGKFFEGMVVFMTGVALPLIHRQFGLDAVEAGVVGAATLFGILVGASTLGGLADRFGRRRVFIFEMALFCVFLALVTVSDGFAMLALFLFGMGVALGGDYPIAHLVISESIPSRNRGRLVLGAFGFQALGALAGTGVGFLVLSQIPDLNAWRWMYAIVIVPALVVVIGRFAITESPSWLLANGRHEHAEQALARLLRRHPPRREPIVVLPDTEPHAHAQGGGLRVLFTGPNRRATLLAAVPWFLQDLGTYGIGVFTPTILARVLGHERAHSHSVADLIHHSSEAAKGAAFLDVLLIVGIAVAVLLADRVGRIRLQVLGFLGCAVGLVLATLSLHASGTSQVMLLFSGFMLFNFMTNMGPNAQTYLLAGEVFPTRCRGIGAGFAASVAKVGAVATVFLFPILLSDLGTDVLLGILVATSVVGALVTLRYRIETAGVSLESIHHPGHDATGDGRS